jgi:hypothetical protein
MAPFRQKYSLTYKSGETEPLNFPNYVNSVIDLIKTVSELFQKCRLVSKRVVFETLFDCVIKGVFDIILF